jgi:hypothetical protein
MTKESSATPTRSRLRKVLRVLAYGCLLGVVVLVTVHFAWKYSGSNQWKKEIDKNGIQVYSRKTPGSVLEDIKATRRVKTRLTVAMATFMETDCAEFMPGCISSRDIVPWSSRDLSATGLFVVRYPFPFSPREYLLKTSVTQDATTKAALMEVTARPDLVPRNKCCFRIEDMDNRWLFTPVGNGELEVEFSMHMDQGLPYPLVNWVSPRMTYKMFEALPEQFDNDKFQNAKLDYIKE